MKSERAVIPFILTKGNGVEVMKYYEGIFDDTKIVSTTFFEGDPIATDGSLMNGTLKLKDELIYFMDMADEYHEGFTNSFSFYVSVESRDEFDRYFNALSVGGKVLMGPEAMMDFEAVTWVIDKFGLTWQIIL